MIRFGVLGAARVVPYGLLTPASEVPGTARGAAVAAVSRGDADGS